MCMTIIVRSVNDNIIFLPAWLMDILKLRDGDLEPQLKILATRQESLLAKIFLESMLALFKIPNNLFPESQYFHLHKGLYKSTNEQFLASNLPTFETITQRIPGLHTGTTWMSDDFDDPLPDEFWLGEADEIVA